MKLSRRNLLKIGAGTAALWTLGGPLLGAAPKKGKRRIPIGVQLYSVRKDCEKDLPAVLEVIAAMGYDGVEFAGYYGREAPELRKLLDDNGLKCCGTHTALATLADDALEETVALNKTLGNKYLIVPSLPKAKRDSVEAARQTARFFNEVAEKVKPQGMLVGYHAHGGDFEKLDGETTAWDVLFSNTGPGVVMQLDIGNCIGGGGDPIAVLKKFPGRSATIHLKEHGGEPGAVVGEGDVNWKKVFRICENSGDTEWYIVEQEGYGALSPLEAIDRCLKNLRKMGK